MIARLLALAEWTCAALFLVLLGCAWTWADWTFLAGAGLAVISAVQVRGLAFAREINARLDVIGAGLREISAPATYRRGDEP